MIESVIVVALVAGAAALVGRKLLGTRRAKEQPAGSGTGCSCPGCPTADRKSRAGRRTTALVLAALCFTPAARAADTTECSPAETADVATYHISDGFGLIATLGPHSD